MLPIERSGEASKPWGWGAFHAPHPHSVYYASARHFLIPQANILTLSPYLQTTHRLLMRQHPQVSRLGWFDSCQTKRATARKGSNI